MIEHGTYYLFAHAHGSWAIFRSIWICCWNLDRFIMSGSVTSKSCNDSLTIIHMNEIKKKTRLAKEQKKNMATNQHKYEPSHLTRLCDWCRRCCCRIVCTGR